MKGARGSLATSETRAPAPVTPTGIRARVGSASRLARAFVGVLSLALVTPAAAQDLACTVTNVARQVEMQRAGGRWTKVEVGARLVPGDQLHTGFKATATIQFPDSSVVQVKPMSFLMIQALEETQGTVKSRIWMRLGEVNAQVGRERAGRSDFQVKTATCTASVRGTRVHRIACHPAIGTIVRMGGEGRLAVVGNRGRARLGPHGSTGVRDDGTTPPTPEESAFKERQSDLGPTGTTPEEIADLMEIGVPKVAPLTEGGSGLAGSVAGGSAASQTVILRIDQLP
ncbi:MAG: FecR domain-containing protein [Candidatus Riflebacteria bacterium]|nr:FecR domain-containing protein [Candidatus Riflebacteria bacterium]